MTFSESLKIPTNKCSVPMNLLDKLLASSTASSITFFEVAVSPILDGSIFSSVGFKFNSSSDFKLPISILSVLSIWFAEHDVSDIIPSNIC